MTLDSVDVLLLPTFEDAAAITKLLKDSSTHTCGFIVDTFLEDSIDIGSEDNTPAGVTLAIEHDSRRHNLGATTNLYDTTTGHILKAVIVKPTSHIMLIMY